MPCGLTRTHFCHAGTEVCYCILSLTAKMYLGWFLLINVLFIDGATADETLKGGGAEAR